MQNQVSVLLARAKSESQDSIDTLIEAVSAIYNEVRPQPAVSTLIPPIGQYWPTQGGINAGLVRGANGGPDYYLIVPVDPAASFEAEWDGRGKSEPNAEDDYDGAANTRALVESDHEHPAAERCAALTIDGHSDFYLPARRELALCFANVPELFERRHCWSSTQLSAYSAWTQSFNFGNQGTYATNHKFAVRAVRRFSPSSI